MTERTDEHNRIDIIVAKAVEAALSDRDQHWRLTKSSLLQVISIGFFVLINGIGMVIYAANLESEHDLLWAAIEAKTADRYYRRDAETQHERLNGEIKIRDERLIALSSIVNANSGRIAVIQEGFGLLSADMRELTTLLQQQQEQRDQLKDWLVAVTDRLSNVERSVSKLGSTQ